MLEAVVINGALCGYGESKGEQIIFDGEVSSSIWRLLHDLFRERTPVTIRVGLDVFEHCALTQIVGNFTYLIVSFKQVQVVPSLRQQLDDARGEIASLKQQLDVRRTVMAGLQKDFNALVDVIRHLVGDRDPREVCEAVAQAIGEKSSSFISLLVAAIRVKKS